MRRAIALAALALLATALGRVPCARAQDAVRATRFDDMGLTRALTPGARATALGGAYVSLANDAHSLTINPAGLARIKRIEVGIGIHQERTDVENTFYSNTMGVDRRAGGLESVSIAVPIPTYRGSFVAAFGVSRMYSGFLDIHYGGANARDRTTDDYFLQQSGALYSYQAGFGVDLSPALSGGLALFVIDGTIDALEQYDYSLEQDVPRVAVFVTEDRTMDIDGFGARFGAQFFLHRRIQAGFTFQTPVFINTRGTSFTQITETVDNGLGSLTEFEGESDSDLILPFEVAVGFTGLISDATVSVQLGYADWAEAAIDRRRLRSASLETVFREVIDYRVGVEYTLPAAPVRLRAGYAYLPHPLRYLQGDRIDEEDFERATVDDERQQISFGIGGLVGSVMTIDAAWVRTHGRRSLPDFADERVMERYLLTATYHF